VANGGQVSNVILGALGYLSVKLFASNTDSKGTTQAPDTVESGHVVDV
jgi:hypothetical protein